MHDRLEPPPVQGSAYGLTIRSHVELRPLLLAPVAGLPELIVEHDPATPSGPDGVDDVRALVTMYDGTRLGVERASGRATVFGRTLDAEELAHPVLGAAASLVARWLAREVFHAGSFAVEGRAVCVVGTNLAGKSTLLGTLAGRGLPIMADDLAFTDGSWLYAGPRTLDLRSARGIGGHLRPVRDNRLRMALDPVPPRLPLGGWLLLEWAPRTSLEPIEASDLLQALIGDRALRALRSDPQTFLDLASQPAWRLRRPCDWSQLDASIDVLLAGVRAAFDSTPAR